jgi:tyrosyl-tRNA synthetase
MLFGRKDVPVSTDEAKVDELLSRCVAEVIPSRQSLKELLLSGKRLRVKLGIDPTSPNIHLGRTVPLLKLRDFQELGHQVVFIAGDFTAVIGDTSDKDAERPMLAKETIEKNLETYKAQVGKILDLSKTEFRRNSEWLEKLTYREIGEHADIFSLSDFIARENIKRRLEEGKRISLREVLYPLLQGYDSVAVEADVELGGSDQRFNTLAGRPLQEHFGQAPQQVLLFSLITDPSGKKMSSSWGNTVNITDAPAAMFGKVMATPDEFVEPYFTHATRVPLSEVALIVKGHPKDAKMFLAETLVRMYHGEEAARQARESFVETFAEGGIPKDVAAVDVARGASLADALLLGRVVESKTELRRLIEKAAVKNAQTGEAFTNLNVKLGESVIVKAGKHRFLSIRIS